LFSLRIDRSDRSINDLDS